MKRRPWLRPLSDDHHGALVLARRVRRAAQQARSASALAKLWSEVAARFAAELEPHFAVEERWLFRALEAAGETALPARALADHARLRDLVRAEPTAAAALELAERLESHVRFEERELFPRAESLLAEPSRAPAPQSGETVRRACVEAALAAYEDAQIRGVCHEGAWEAAVSALRTVELPEP